MKTSNDTSALTGLPGSVMIGCAADRVPAPCGMPGCIATLTNSTPPPKRVLDDFVGARADPAGGDDQVGVAGVRSEHRAELVDVVAGHRGRCDHLARPHRATAAASMTALDS